MKHSFAIIYIKKIVIVLYQNTAGCSLSREMALMKWHRLFNPLWTLAIFTNFAKFANLLKFPQWVSQSETILFRKNRI
jgi:hypothetical protein